MHAQTHYVKDTYLEQHTHAKIDKKNHIGREGNKI